MKTLSIVDGWIQDIAQIPSPNFFELQGREVSLLVVHNISLPPGKYGGPYIDQLFTNQLNPKDDPFFATIHQLKVAAHLLIQRTGAIRQYVSFDKCAHHAGVSSFKGRSACNEFSIGIELEGTDTDPYTDSQYQALADVTLLLMKTYPLIKTDRIVGHSDIAPERKTDPGPSFDWARYRKQITR